MKWRNWLHTWGRLNNRGTAHMGDPQWGTLPVWILFHKTNFQLCFQMYFHSEQYKHGCFLGFKANYILPPPPLMYKETPGIKLESIVNHCRVISKSWELWLSQSSSEDIPALCWSIFLWDLSYSTFPGSSCKDCEIILSCAKFWCKVSIYYCFLCVFLKNFTWELAVHIKRTWHFSALLLWWLHCLFLWLRKRSF